MNDRVRTLAAEFDRAFAEPARALEAHGGDVLTIRVAGNEYLLKLAVVSTVARLPRIMPLPNSSALSLGIAGLRGNLVTVFSLAALLGLPGDNAIMGDTRANGWIAALVRHRGMAIAFDVLEGQRPLLAGEKPPNILDITALLERGGITL